MVMGRPRDYDLKQMAVDLLKWSQQDDSFNLNGFCASKLIPPRYLSRWAKEDEDFCLAFECTKAVLGDKREKGLNAGTVHVKAYDLNAKVYDHFLKEEYRSNLEFENKLKTEQAESVGEEFHKQSQAIIDMINEKQANAEASS